MPGAHETEHEFRPVGLAELSTIFNSSTIRLIKSASEGRSSVSAGSNTILATRLQQNLACYGSTISVPTIPASRCPPMPQ